VLAEELKKLGAKRELIRMAERGQLLKLICEMPTCYREYEQPGGRELFDAWPSGDDVQRMLVVSLNRCQVPLGLVEQGPVVRPVVESTHPRT